MENTIVLTEQEYKQMVASIKANALQVQRENKSTFRQVMDEFEDDFQKFNWIEHHSVVNPDGDLIEWDYGGYEAYKVRTAIGTLIRAVFRVKHTANIPSDKADEVRQFVEKMLGVIKEITA